VAAWVVAHHLAQIASLAVHHLVVAQKDLHFVDRQLEALLSLSFCFSANV
jgi:hypothetical protein